MTGDTQEVRELQDMLRRAGLRVTPQRMMVLAALAAGEGHLTADEIFDLVRREYPFLNRSTVYRTLDLLVELGLVAATDLGEGVRQFELVGAAPHHHLICQRCGATAEIADELLQPLRTRLAEEYGFEARMDHFAIFGLCRACRAGNGAAPGR
ncbi:MAG: Fur family transcriptional regulator [Sphaerobacter sp.]|nr:Fur family transcriptional regulator [Sphaerobacter sp.]